MANTLGKKITFCRSKKNRGIYTGNVSKNGKVIRLVDREVCTPTDPDEVKFLMEDPEIEILCSSRDEQNDENERNKEKAKK